MNEIFRNISKNEKIIFQTSTSKENKYKKYGKFIPVFTIIYLIIINIFLDLLFRGHISFSFFDLFILLLVVISSFPMYHLFSKMGRQSAESLIITDKRIYKQTGEQTTASIDSVDLNTLKAMTFHLSKYEKTNQLGTIKFIPEVRVGKEYALKSTCIPNFNEFQKIIESIVYKYANIEERWQIVKEQLNIRFPYQVKGSEQIRKRISHKSKRHLALLFIFIPLLIFGIFMLPIAFSQEKEAAMELLFYISFILLAFGAIYTTIIIVQKIMWKKRSSDISTVLTLDSNKITLTESKKEISIPLDSSIFVDILKIENYAAGFFRWRDSKDGIRLKWKDDLDGIIIQPSFLSKDVIKFGPFDKFPEIFEAIFCYILKWKADNGLLLSMKEISKYDMKKFERMEEEHREEYPTPKILVPKVRDIDLKPLEKSNPLYTRLGIHIEPDELIFFSYDEVHKYKKMIGISLLLFIPTLILTILIYMTDIFSTTILFFLLSLFIPVVCCLSSIFLSSGIYSKCKVGDLLYIFTNKKIFVDFRTNTCQIRYDNVSTILRRTVLKGKYQIEINLKNKIDGNPHEVKGQNIDKFFISKIPPNNNLIDKLMWLKEKVSN